MIFVLTRFSERILGLISTLILARLLTPDDFGIVAISMLVLNFFFILSDSGAENYIIKKNALTESDINTAWTLNIILKFLVAIILWILSQQIANYFNDERLLDILYVVTPLLIFSSFASPSIYLLKRDQNYRPLFKLIIFQKLFSVSIVIFIAVYYQSYWALIFGHVASSTFHTIGSFRIYKYRPKFDLSKINEQWDFSKWILLSSIFGFVRSQLDTILASKFFSVAEVGAFHTMKYISTMPGSQIIEPAITPLLSTISRSIDDQDQYRYQIKLSYLVLLLVTLPSAIFLYWYANIIVQILLGQQWLAYSEIFGTLALLIISISFMSLSGHILISSNRPRLIFIYNLFSLVGLFVILFSIREYPLFYFTLARTVFDISITSLFFFTIAKLFVKIPIKELLIPCALILTSSYLSALFSMYFKAPGLNEIVKLIFAGVAFSSFYCLLVFILYRVYYKKTKEGAHLGFLVHKLVTKASGKLSSI